MRRIALIVIHYTDSSDVSWRTIDDWHKAKWPDNPDPSGKYISYHKVIRKDGSIEQGRAEESIGWHAKGFNSESLGVVLAGTDKELWYPSEAQYKALANVLVYWMQRYAIPYTQIYFHRELNSTSCPGRLSKAQVLSMLKPQEESEEDMDFAFVPPTLNSTATDYEFIGLDTSGDKKVWLDLRARAKNAPLELSVKIFPLSRQKIPSYKLMLADEFPFVEELWHKVDGGFSVRVKSNGPKFAAAVKQGR